MSFEILLPFAVVPLVATSRNAVRRGTIERRDAQRHAVRAPSDRGFVHACHGMERV